MKETKNLEQNLDNRNKKLHISDISCSYIDIMGEVALIKRENDRKWAERNGIE